MRKKIILLVLISFCIVSAVMTKEGDWTNDAPGVRHRISLADLPKPYATPSAENDADLVQRPSNVLLQVPQGFQVSEFVSGLHNPRLLRTAPNGDVFVSESRAGRVRVLRIADDGTKPTKNEVFAFALNRPFGIAFYPPGPNPQYIYIANTDAVLRFPYHNGDLKATADGKVIAKLPGGGMVHAGGHWTRDIVFSKDGKKMFVSVGSYSNAMENPKDDEKNRAAILEYNPDGSGFRIYASGIRNAVGIAIHPQTNDLWASVNERDELGDDLVPDYITRVKDGGFYGWPWFYLGKNQDPRHQGAHPELRDKVIVPDVLIQAHSASLQMAIYAANQFPERYRNSAFAAEHGSWNRRQPTGYKVIFVPIKNGVPTGDYEDFMTGFITKEGKIWGRPVGVTVTKDGALLVSDDGSDTIWRVAYTSR